MERVYTPPLIESAKKGDLSKVQELISRSSISDLNVRDDKQGTALMHASNYGHLEIVRALLSAKADPGLKNHENSTALLAAVCRGRSEVASELIKFKADTNLTSETGRTLLVAAAALGHTEVVRVLVNARANVNARESKGKSALDYAIQFRKEEMQSILRGAGASEGSSPTSPCIAAATSYSPGPAATSYYPPAAAAPSYYSPAASSRAPSMGPALEYRKEPNKTSLIGSPASEQFYKAIDEGNLVKVRKLIHEGKNLETQHNGRTPLAAALEKKHADIAMALIQAGAHPNKKDKFGETPLSRACLMRNESLVATLIAKGVDVNAGAPLVWVMSNEYKKIALMLMDAGTDINAGNKYGHPLLMACNQNLSDLVLTLISRNVNLEFKYNRTDNDTYQYGDNALIVAVRNGNASIVQILLNAKANVHEANRAGQTAMSLARANGNTGIAQMLLQAGACEPAPSRQVSHQPTPSSYHASAPAKPNPMHHAQSHHRPGGMTQQQRLKLMEEEIKVAKDFVGLVNTVENDFFGGGGGYS